VRRITSLLCLIVTVSLLYATNIWLSPVFADTLLLSGFLPNTLPPQSPSKTSVRKQALQNNNGNPKYQFIDRIYPEGMTPKEFKKLNVEFKSQPEGLKKPTSIARTYSLGDREILWTQSNKIFKQITAECRKVTNEAYVFVALTDNYGNNVYYNGYNSGYISQTDVDQIGNKFSYIYSTDRNAFGNETATGLNGESKVTILLLDIDDTYALKPNTDSYKYGYFYGTDMLSEIFVRNYGYHSNERKILYIDTYPAIEYTSPPNTNHNNYGEYGITNTYSTLAHEFQHMIHNRMDSDEELWVNEGCSGLAEFICGFWLKNAH
jgi:hypothetical protein